MQPRILIIALIGIVAIALLWVPAQEKKGVAIPNEKDDARLFSGFDSGGCSFKPDPYIEMAAALQRQGKENAIQALRDGKLGDLVDKELRFDGRFVLYRMLFVAKKGGEFRRPNIGVPDFLLGGLGGETGEWPLEPIALVDGVPFCIVRGYSLDGMPELPSSYLHYFLENCDWNDYQFRPKSKAEKQAAFGKLFRASLKMGLRDYRRAFLEAQIE